MGIKKEITTQNVRCINWGLKECGIVKILVFFLAVRCESSHLTFVASARFLDLSQAVRKDVSETLDTCQQDQASTMTKICCLPYTLLYKASLDLVAAIMRGG